MGENLMSLARSGGKYLKLFGDGKMVKTLPYDAEIEWLRSDGNAFIETDSLSSDDSVLTVWLNYKGTGWKANQIIIGAMGNDDESDRTFILLRTYNYGKTYANFASNFNGYNIDMPSIYNAKYKIDRSGVYCNDELVYVLNQYGNKIKPAKVCLFFYRNGGTLSWKRNSIFDIIRCTHDIDGVNVMDLIPVRFTNENGDREGAMYDRVSGELFRNVGTGAFVIGPDKTA